MIGAQTDATSIANNGAVQQQQYFADTYKFQKNKLIAEMRKAILNSGYTGAGQFWNAASMFLLSAGDASNLNLGPYGRYDE